MRFYSNLPIKKIFKGELIDGCTFLTISKKPAILASLFKLKIDRLYSEGRVSFYILYKDIMRFYSNLPIKMFAYEVAQMVPKHTLDLVDKEFYEK